MKAFSNVKPKSVGEAVSLLQKTQQKGQTAAIAGGGSDLLGMIKEHLAQPDVLVHLDSIPGLDRIEADGDGLKIGGLVTLDTLSHDPRIRSRYTVLAEAAEAVGTPQIRNAGTLAGNVCQRPWCWYYRNAFPCYKNGGKTCFSIGGENQLHAIFGGGPSFIVHPSDTAPALVALDAKFHVAGPAGERVIPAAEFFTLPRVDPSKENALTKQDVLIAVHLPAERPGTRGMYHKVLDREAWTHAVVSAAIVLEMDGDLCRSAKVVLGGVAPIPWHLPKVEAALAGQRITPELAAKAGAIAIEGAQPLSHNRYKIPITQAVVKRTILATAAKS